MAWIKIKSMLSGKTDLVTDEAYKSYVEPTGIYTVVSDEKKPEPKPQPKPVVEEKVEPVAEKPKKTQPAITPIKPLKTKSGDNSKINTEI